MIAIGSDHIGLELKNSLIQILGEQNILVKDFGTYSNERVDYPVYGEMVARSVVTGESEKGIVICGTGIGISIAANKVFGARTALCVNNYMAQMSRAHNNSNILAIGANVLNLEAAKEVLMIWLGTAYEGGRHQRRLDLIELIEDHNYKTV